MLQSGTSLQDGVIDVGNVSVALSGGGHRAALFAAGALMALTDTGVNQQVGVIASVSGGSITNGLVAKSGDFAAQDTDTEKLKGWLRPVLAMIHRNGLFFPGKPTNGYVRGVFLLFGLLTASLLTLITFCVAIGRPSSWQTAWIVAAIELGVSLLAAVALWLFKRAKLKLEVVWPFIVGLLGIAACAPAVRFSFAPGHSTKTSVFTAAAVVLYAFAAYQLAVRRFGLRSQKVDDALRCVLFGGATLASIDRSVHHVFCTTNLASGTQAFLTPRLVSCSRMGIEHPSPTLKLSTAVQVSSAFPGGFNARRLTASELFAAPTGAELTVADLADGGVYDNMADQWELGWAERRKRLESESGPALTSFNTQQSHMLVVINAGGSYDPEPIKGRGLGREIAALMKDKDVMYAQTTAVKRRYLYRLFVEGGLLHGALAQITQSPYDVPNDLAPAPDTAPANDFQARARMAIGFLDQVASPGPGATRQAAWSHVRDRSHSISTVLSTLDPAVCVNLMLHAYVLTRINLFVLLGLGSLPDPADAAEMRKWTHEPFQELVESS
ncbi:MAG: hypothetical protein QM747_06115 [Nocardioides sp.]